MSSLKLGTKIVLSIGSIVFICMLGLLMIVVYNVDKEQTHISERLLSAVADESVEIIRNDINSAYMTLASIQASLEDIVSSGNTKSHQDMLESQLKAMIDGNISGMYAYIYIKDSSYKNENIINPKNRLSNGEFMILTHDKNPDKVGGIEMLSADMAILEFGSVKKALATGKPSIGEPRYVNIAKQGERLGFAINVPLKSKSGQIIGLTGVFIDLSTISGAILDDKLSAFQNDYRMVLSQDGTIAIHPDKTMLGNSFQDKSTHTSANAIIEAITKQEGGLFDYTTYKGINTMAELKVFEVGINTGIFWSILAVAPKDSVYASLYRLETVVIISICISLLLIVLAIFLYIISHSQHL